MTARTVDAVCSHQLMHTDAWCVRCDRRTPPKMPLCRVIWARSVLAPSRLCHTAVACCFAQRLVDAEVGLETPPLELDTYARLWRLVPYVDDEAIAQLLGMQR